jgi:hypothetical protein
MLEINQLDAPYELVRSGKWTYDAMSVLMKKVINLNGDESFAGDDSGSCIYGLGVQHVGGVISLLLGSSEYIVGKDQDGEPVINSDRSKLFDAIEKLNQVVSPDGAMLMYNKSVDHSSFVMFVGGRELFYQGASGQSLSADMRNCTSEYGILPIPKLSESQKNYCVPNNQYTLTLAVPKTVSDLDYTGTVLDYLAFLSYRDVVPALQTALCYKGLRDDNSIEMLEIIRNSQHNDMGFLYSWSSDLMTKFCDNIANNKETAASAYEENITAVEGKMDKTMEIINAQ